MTPKFIDAQTLINNAGTEQEVYLSRCFLALYCSQETSIVSKCSMFYWLQLLEEKEPKLSLPLPLDFKIQAQHIVCDNNEIQARSSDNIIIAQKKDPIFCLPLSLCLGIQAPQILATVETKHSDNSSILHLSLSLPKLLRHHDTRPWLSTYGHVGSVVN